MANLHFATRTYPTFGTAARPKPESAWKSSVYYWWWEYLRRHAGYKKCCEQNGAGRLAALYADFGNVHALDFKSWWSDGNRGGRLFAEPEEKVLLSELTHEQLVQFGEWNTDAVMVVVVPLTQNKRHLTKRFSVLLKKRHGGARGKRLLSQSAATYPLKSQFKIASLRAALVAYDIRHADPKRPLWKVAIDAGLANTVRREIKQQKTLPDAEQRNALSVAASRAIKRATAMIENAGKGVFPKA